MAVPVLQSGFKITQQEESTSVVVDKPDGTVEGDLLVAMICSDGSETFTPAAGFTPIADPLVSGGGGNECTTQTWWKTAGASEPANYTWTIATSEEAVLAMVRVTGQYHDDPIAAVKTATGASATPACPDLTTHRDDALVLRFYGADDDDQDTDAGYPAGHAGVFNRGSSTTAGSCSAGLAHEDQATKGAVGTATFTNLASEDWSAWTVVVYSRQPVHVISADDVADKHYKHQGFSSTIMDSYASPHDRPDGITWDGDVMSADRHATVGGKHFLHSGFSGTLLDSYSFVGAVGLSWDGGNVVSVGATFDVHYLQSGFTATLNDSYFAPSTDPRGISWDGDNVISTDAFTDKHYLHSGFSATITDSYASPGLVPSGITWSDAGVISANKGDKHYLHSGFSATITDSYSSPSTGGTGITWTGRYEFVGMTPIMRGGVIPLRGTEIT